MSMKKWFRSIGVASLLVGMLAACGGNDTSTSNETSKDNGNGDNSNEEVVEIILSGWGGNPEETTLLAETLEAFEDKYPNIKVKHDIISDQYMDVLQTRLIGGEAADVFYLDAFEAPALIESGVLEPLDQYVTADFDIDDFEKPMLEAFQEDGVTYGFPKDYSTIALFYNKTMLAEANVEVPTTWEEFRQAAIELTQGTEVYGFGAAPELARAYYIGESKGGKIVTDNQASFGDDRVIEALQPIVDMRNVDKSAAQPSEVGSGWGGEMFGQGKAAMVIEGNWAIPFIENNFSEIDFGTAEVPTIDGQKGTMAYTVAYVMNKESDKKEAAWKLIEFLTGKEGMEIWTSKGFALPTRISVAETLGWDLDEKRAAIVAGAPYATVWQQGTNLPIINQNFNNQFLSAFIGQRPLDESLKEAEEIANREINR
ncbi:ABC transporter substrate-binding protein [Bacillaceae bacterium IKA-2]|nr:ABC transporter substrate-binding protein [Bacillaceae bacterium IKA-2]